MKRTHSIALVTFAVLAFSLVFGQMAFSQIIEKAGFAVPHESEASTLFSKLNPDDTGLVVDNAYDDPEMWGTRYREYMGGSMGSGIAAGDYDGDGKLDIYVSTKTKPGRLFRNLGEWKFEDVTEEAGLAETSGVMGWLRSAVSSEEEVVWRHGSVFADIDNDGDKDLYVCRNGAPNLLYVNQGDGTFEEEGEERGLGLSDGSVVGAFADFDRDGWLDVLVLTNQMDGTEPNGRLDRLYRNIGGGRFVEITQEAGISGDTFGHAVIWFDYNEDLWPDFYISNDYAGPDYLYRNNGDGTFTNVVDEVVPHTSYSTMALDTADVDNNGHVDLFLGDMAATSRETEMRRKPAASKEDLLSIGSKSRVAPQYTRNSLLLNMGTDFFLEAACWAGLDATDWTWSVRFEDFDNDGWMDLHVTNGMVREANNSDLLARMMKARSTPQRIGVMNRSPRLEESNLAFRNLAGGQFEDVTKKWGLENIGVSFGAVMGDFDRDGDMDIVYLNHGEGLSVYRNDAAGGNRVQVRLRGGESNRDALGALVKIETRTGVQVRALTSARGYSSGSELVTHFGLGSETEIDRLTVEWPSGAKQVFENLDANSAYLIGEGGAVSDRSDKVQRETLFVSRAGAYGLKLTDESELAISDQEQFLLPFRTDRHGPALAVGDVDGNGREDLYVAATTGSAARLILSKDGGYEQVAVSGLDVSPLEDGPVLLFDANGDGTEDLLVTKASAKSALWPQGFEPLIYSNDGQGNLSKTNWLPSLSINVGAAALGDVDGDGDLDLFLGARSIPGEYPAGPRSYLLLAQEGRFVVSAGAGLDDIGLVKSALFRDVDGDGRPDLIVALEWDSVRYYRNAGGGIFEDRTTAAGFDLGLRGWWNGLASGDFNGDGRLDFAVGNLGLNTTYEASREAPTSLYYGSFGASIQKVIVEAVYEEGTLYPLRARGDIGNRLGHAVRRFPLSDDYAKATLHEVFGASALDAAELFEADRFLSGVFLSQENGSYDFSPFPPQAQIGPILGLLAEDFDGDGFLDVFASQNTDVATPSFHGGVGLLLTGKGDGRFDVIEPSRSGVSIPGNGRAAVVLDAAGGGKPGVFSTRHRGESVYLENTSSSVDWLAIRLTGSKLNPHAVGAQLRFVYEDGYERIQEVGMGGGWMSQSSALVWVANSEERRLASVTVRWTDGELSELSEIPKNGVWKIAK